MRVLGGDQLEIQLLARGPRVLVENRPVPAGPQKAQLLLAVLAHSVGRPVPKSDLVRYLWGQDPPPSVDNTLHSQVSRLRKSLVKAGHPAPIHHRNGGYVLDVPGDTVDLLRVGGLDKRARECVRRGEYREAADLYDRALGHWSEDPLCELGGAWAEKVREECSRLRTDLLARWADAALALGLAPQVNERLAGHEDTDVLTLAHMSALMAEGRHADAIGCYGRLRERMREEQGTEPNPRTRRLFERALGEADGEQPVPLTGRPTGPDVFETVDTLRADIAGFVGREEEVESLLDRVRQDRAAPCVQLITGIGGMGKTALAVHVAHLVREDYDLRLDVEVGDNRVDVVLGRLLVMIGVPESAVPSDLDARVALWRRHVAGRKVLLVLDNVREGTVLPMLVPGAKDSLVLVTSRRDLRDLDGAATTTLGRLEDEDAAAMLTRAGGQGDEPGTARVIELVGGMPLALRVASRNLRRRPSWGMQDLAERLSRKDSPTRQGVEQAAFPAFVDAFEFLTPSARLTFLALGLHPTPVVGDSALAEMVGGRSTMESGIEELLDTHFVDEVGAGRYRSHDILRAFARHQASSTAEGVSPPELDKRMRDHYLRVVESADRVAWPQRRRSLWRGWSAPADPCFASAWEARQWFVDHLPMLEAVALHTARNGALEHAARLPLAMAGLLEICGPWSAAEPLLESSCQAWHELQDAAGLASALCQLGHFRRLRGKRVEAEEALHRSLALWKDIGDEGGVAHVLDQLGQIRVAAGDRTGALDDYREALEIFRRLGDEWGMARIHTHLAFCRQRMGQFDHAKSSFITARSFYWAVGDKRLETSMMLNLARLEISKGRHREARRMCESARAIFRRRNDVLGAAQSEHCLGMVSQYLGDHDEALARFRTALRGFWAAGDEQWLANSTAQSVQELLELGREEEARAALVPGIQRARASEQDISLASLMRALGDLHRGHGRVADAERCYTEACDEALRVSDSEALGHAHRRLGDLAHRRGDHQAALVSWRRSAQAFSALPTYFLAEVETKIEALLDVLDMTG